MHLEREDINRLCQRVLSWQRNALVQKLGSLRTKISMNIEILLWIGAVVSPLLNHR